MPNEAADPHRLLGYPVVVVAVNFRAAMAIGILGGAVVVLLLCKGLLDIARAIMNAP